MHVGRLSDPLLLQGEAPAGPSAVRPDPLARHYAVNTPRPKRSYQAPRALSQAEILATIDDFANCATRARRAGVDGVEIHGASGYLPMQFLSTNTNLRTDAWGGTMERRAAFLLACVDAMIAATSRDFVAVKVSPGWTVNDVFDDDAPATYSHVVRELSRCGIAYLQFADMSVGWDVCGTLAPLFEGPVMLYNGFTRRTGADAVRQGRAQLVAFGQAFIANPDLVERLRNNQPITRPRVETYYTQGEEGYTDYPVYADADEQSMQSPDEPLVPV